MVTFIKNKIKNHMFREEANWSKKPVTGMRPNLAKLLINALRRLREHEKGDE